MDPKAAQNIDLVIEYFHYLELLVRLGVRRPILYREA